LIDVETPWGETRQAVTYMTVVDQAKRNSEKIIPDKNASGSWQRVSTYGGKLAENNTQAISRDLLADAMLRLEAAGFKVVMHVHDEVVCEAPIGERTLDEMNSLMTQVEPWAAGFPVAAAGFTATRYRKD